MSLATERMTCALVPNTRRLCAGHLLFSLACVIGVLALAGCSASGEAGTGDERTLYVFNWSDYIDPELIDEFQAKTGIRVVYDNYSSEGELESKLLAGSSGYDVVFPSDANIRVFSHKGVLREIDHSRLSHWKNLDPQFLNPPHDSGNKYSVPYFWGTIAVGIRTDHVTGPVKGFEVLFDERYRGRITMLDDPENVIAVALLHLGLPMNSVDDAHLAQAEALLTQQAPLVQAYTGDAFKEKLISGDAWVVLGWSGDLLQARDAEAGDGDEEPPAPESHIQTIVPESGTMIWLDSMCIPKDAPHPDLAYEFINFMLDADVAARNAKYVKYASPNRAARDLIDPEILADPSVYPRPEVIERCQWLKDRGAAIEKLEAVWERVRND